MLTIYMIHDLHLYDLVIELFHFAKIQHLVVALVQKKDDCMISSRKKKLHVSSWSIVVYRSLTQQKWFANAFTLKKIIIIKKLRQTIMKQNEHRFRVLFSSLIVQISQSILFKSLSHSIFHTSMKAMFELSNVVYERSTSMIFFSFFVDKFWLKSSIFIAFNRLIWRYIFNIFCKSILMSTRFMLKSMRKFSIVKVFFLRAWFLR